MANQRPTDLLVSNRSAFYSENNRPSPTTSPTKVDASVWVNELGHGHGKQTYMLNKRRSSFNSKLDAEQSRNGGPAENVFLPFQRGNSAGPDSEGNTSPKLPTESHSVLFQGNSKFLGGAISTPSPGPTSSLTSALSAARVSDNNLIAQSLDGTGQILRTVSHNSDSSTGSGWDKNMYSRSAVDLTHMYSGESGNVRTNSSDSSTMHVPHPYSGFGHDSFGSGHLAMSPAIPIAAPSSSFSTFSHHPHGSQQPFGGYSGSLSNIGSLPRPPIWGAQAAFQQQSSQQEKMAGSFVESRLSVLKDADLNRKLIVEEVDGEYDDNSDVEPDGDSEDEDDEDGMFAMDEGNNNDSASKSGSKQVTPSPPLSAGKVGERNSPAEQRALSGSFSNSNVRSFRNGSFTAALGLTDSSQPLDMFIRLGSGYCTKQGPRKANEDRLIVIPDLYSVMQEFDAPISANVSSSSSSSASMAGRGLTRVGTPSRERDLCGYFAVYDGHAGDCVSIFLENEFHPAVFRHPLFSSDLPGAISDVCRNLDRAILQICNEKNLCSGSTALGAFVRGNQLTVFNVGDCQAVLCTSGKARIMCDPHKPGREDEKTRVESAGGWVTEESELYLARLHVMDLSDPLVRDKAQGVNYVKIHRVCGELAISRSFGDPDYKSVNPGVKVDAFFMWPDDHEEIFYADLVIPDPEFMTATLTLEDQFLIVACDGIWDVLSEDDAVRSVSSSISTGLSASQAAEILCDLALRLGSSDNVTVVIVEFNHQYR